MNKHFFTNNPSLGITVEKVGRKVDSRRTLVPTTQLHEMKHQAHLLVISAIYSNIPWM